GATISASFVTESSENTFPALPVERSARECVDLALEKFKRLDVLINNAGVFLDNAMTQDYPISDFDETIRRNIRSAFMMTRFALPFLQKTRGNIISAGSESGMIGLAQNTPYKRHERLDACLYPRCGGGAGEKWSARELCL